MALHIRPRRTRGHTRHHRAPRVPIRWVRVNVPSRSGSRRLLCSWVFFVRLGWHRGGDDGGTVRGVLGRLVRRRRVLVQVALAVVWPYSGWLKGVD